MDALIPAVCLLTGNAGCPVSGNSRTAPEWPPLLPGWAMVDVVAGAATGAVEPGTRSPTTRGRGFSGFSGRQDGCGG
jgi:hypothetical protein